MVSKFSVTVVMPALNEEKSVIASIDNTLACFDDLGIEGEVIVVNDGSTDNTPRLVEEKMKKNSRVRMLTHQTPQGIGSSFWDGVEDAKGDTVLIIPADNENDPWETLQYVGLLQHVDIVIPFTFNKNIRSPLRNFLSSLYIFIVNTTFKTSFNYTNSTVIYRRGMLRQLKYRSYTFFFQTDILIRATKRGYLFSEVPYRLGARKAGKSKLLSWASLWKGAKDYLRLVKHLYFTERKELRKKDFCPDSLTAKRYKYARNPKYKEIL